MQGLIEISDEITSEFKNMALRRKYRYIIFKASEDYTKVEIEKKGERDETWE